VGEVYIFISGGQKRDEVLQEVCHQEEFGGKRPHVGGVHIIPGSPQGRQRSPWCLSPGRIWRESVTWMRCKYLYLEAPRETNLSKMSVTRKDLVGKGHVDEMLIFIPHCIKTEALIF
jgi:hypothetical protein